jgi:hypothetical protein
MTTPRDPDRLIHAFLREGAEQLDDQVYDAVRADIDHKRQRVVIGPWRVPTVSKLVPIGLGVAAVIAAIFIGSRFIGSPSSNVGGPAVESSPTPQPSVVAQSTQPSSTPEPSPSATGVIPEGPHLLLSEGSEPMEITVTISAPGWFGEPGSYYVIRGEDADPPPDRAGMLVYSGSEYYVYGDACTWSSTKPNTPATTVDELVDALANQASREASAPEDITVDGYAGKKIILNMADDVDLDACDEGLFALFGQQEGEVETADDVARYSQGPGQIEEVWAVDVDGLVVVLDGAYHADAPQNVVDELRDMFASATVELP